MDKEPASEWVSQRVGQLASGSASEWVS